MSVVVHSCINCGAPNFANSIRCGACLQVNKALNSPSSVLNAKLVATHVLWAIAACSLVSAVSRFDDPTICPPPPLSSPAQITEQKAEPKEETQASYSDRIARDSLEEVSREIAADPKDYEAYEARGWFLFKERGEAKRAIDDLTKAIKLQPKWAQPYCERAWIYYFLGLHRKALADAKVALRLDPGNSQAQEVRGLCVQ
jgi:tetratricopeptide (TPR) repeat protein